MINLIKYILLISILITLNNAKDKEINKFIFSINDNKFTSIDLKERVYYLKAINSYKTDKLSKEDYISVIIFDFYSNEKKIRIKKEIIENFLIQIKSKLPENIEYKEDILKRNIIYDYQRKLILENLLDKKNNRIIKREDISAINLYDIRLKYIIIPKNDINKNNIINSWLNKKLIDFENYLGSVNKKYITVNKEIINLNNLSTEVQKKILNLENKFLVANNNYTALYNIQYTIKKNIETKVNLVNFEITNKNLKMKDISCDKLKKYTENKKIKILNNFNKLEVEKINNELLKKLYKTNDIVVVDNNNQIILCELTINTLKINEETFNKNIQKIVKDLEVEFIINQKKIYKYNEK